MDGAVSEPMRRHYGAGACQYGDLYLGAAQRRWRAIVLIHGGFWRPHRSLDMTTPAAADLAGRGWNIWNIEYRRNGQGEWPATLEDCASAIDHLSVLGEEFSFNGADAIVVGHSAGGHLAVWSAGRQAVTSGPSSRPPSVQVGGVVSLAGILDFRRAVAAGTGDDAVAGFVGGVPEELPRRYAEADPMARLPTHTPVRCVHSRADERVPFELSNSYVSAAHQSGDDVELIEVGGLHTDIIDVDHPAWQVVVATIDSLDR